MLVVRASPTEDPMASQVRLGPRLPAVELSGECRVTWCARQRGQDNQRVLASSLDRVRHATWDHTQRPRGKRGHLVADAYRTLARDHVQDFVEIVMAVRRE